uniref:Uncharacterized protein n=1 Tax=Trieres chinensis TaxID=1514140 RepID=A0A7S2A7Q2_TRICV
MQRGSQNSGQTKMRSSTIAITVQASMMSRVLVTISCWQNGQVNPVGFLPMSVLITMLDVTTVVVVLMVFVVDGAIGVDFPVGVAGNFVLNDPPSSPLPMLPGE